MPYNAVSTLSVVEIQYDFRSSHSATNIEWLSGWGLFSLSVLSGCGSSLRYSHWNVPKAVSSERIVKCLSLREAALRAQILRHSKFHAPRGRHIQLRILGAF